MSPGRGCLVRGGGWWGGGGGVGWVAKIVAIHNVTTIQVNIHAFPTMVKILEWSLTTLLLVYRSLGLDSSYL